MFLFKVSNIFFYVMLATSKEVSRMVQMLVHYDVRCINTTCCRSGPACLLSDN